MLTGLDNQLTYLGTIDDVVFRYPWDRPISLSSIQHQLVTSAIYDKKLLINDGYLVANPTLLSELADPNRSLLGRMLMNGQAWLFTRSGTVSIAQGIEEQSGRVDTHSDLVKRSSWSEIRDNLEGLSRYTKDDAVHWPADKNMGLAFYLLMKEIRDVLLHTIADASSTRTWSDFGRVFERFDAEIEKPSYLGARSAWERAAWAEIAQTSVNPFDLMNARPGTREKAFPGYDRVRRLMGVANQVYHYAYTAAARHSLESSNHPLGRSQIGVASGFSFLHPGMTEVATSPEQMHDRRSALLARLALSLPADTRFKSDFSAVTSIETDGDCRRARQHYLTELRKVWEGQDDLAAAERARNHYRAQLARVLQPMIEDKFVEFTSKVIFAPLNFVLGKAIPGLGGLFGFVIGVDRQQKKLVERLMTRRVETALDENAILAIQSGRPIPVRSEDLYFGPLRNDGAERLMQAVSGPKP